MAITSFSEKFSKKRESKRTRLPLSSVHKPSGIPTLKALSLRKLQILGPPKKKGADFVSEMFKRARESGAEAVEGSSSSGAPGSSRGGGGGAAFRGTAFKLGSDETPSESVADPRAARRQAEPREFTLKMWQNGFSIDDGELRDYNDPRNRAFLASVMSGRIPEELVREARDAIQLCREFFTCFLKTYCSLIFLVQ